MAADLDAADWSLGPSEFRGLRIVVQGASGIPAMNLTPSGSDGWEPLQRCWLRLAPHPQMLELLLPNTLRYAAIDWKATPAPGDALANAIKVAHVFEHVVNRVDHSDWVWFQRACVLFDLRGRPRVWWRPVELTDEDLAPEAKSTWLQPTEKMLVHALGYALMQVGLDNDPKGATIIRRCLARPSLRTKTIDAVIKTLELQLRADLPARSAVWDLTETGIGWLALDRLADASLCFEKALDLAPGYPLAVEGRTRATMAVGDADLGKARRLEDERWWADAMTEYRRCRALMTAVDYHLSIARCLIGLGRDADALIFAVRAMQASPDDPEPYRMLVPLALSSRRREEAVIACEELVARQPALASEVLLQVLKDVVLLKDVGGMMLTDRCLALLPRVPVDPERLARLVQNLPVSTTSVKLCRHLLTLSAEHGASAVSSLVRVEQGRFELVRDVFDLLVELPPELGTRGVLEVLRKTGDSSFERATQLAVRIDDARGLEAQATLVEMAFQRGDLTAALSLADHMIATYPRSGLGLYRRGRVLFRLGRLVEARDALDRAQVIEPTLLDAMLLRREVDKAITKVRAVVGSAVPQQLAIPEYLPEVRAAMARGSVPDAVSWLEGHEIGDGVARLLLGNLLVGQERFADALRAFERVGGEHVRDALLGKARALAASGRGEEALRLLDRIVAEDPDSTEAMVVRARVVDLLR